MSEDLPLNNEEFARLIDRLDEKDGDLEARLYKLEVIMNGDAAARARWEAGKLNYPSMAEPPPGLVDQVLRDRADRVTWEDKLQRTVESAMAALNTKAAFASRLEAFFGPLIANRNPPLDGEQIATKAFVDAGIERFSRAIRDELHTATALSVLFVKDTIQQITGWDRKPSGGEPNAMNAAVRLGQLHRDFIARERAAHERATRPSRWQLLVGFLRGRPAVAAAPPAFYYPAPDVAGGDR